MRNLAVATALFASVAFSQTPAAPAAPLTRVFYFTHASTPQQIQEINNIVRAMAEINATSDATRKSLSVQGTNTQLALAEWIVSEMDRATPPAPSPAPAVQPFTNGRGQLELVRVFTLQHATTPPQIQELTNLIRSISDMQRVFPYNALHQLVVRGTADQLGTAEWLIQQLDRTPGTPAPDAGTRQVPFTFKITHTAKVFYLTHDQSPQQTQAIVNRLRADVKVDRIYPYHSQHAIALRGTSEQVAAAAELLNQLDQPAQ